MKKILVSFSLVLIVQSINMIHAQIQRPIGTNLTGIVDYSTEYVFVDVFNQSREWIAHANVGGAPWSSGVNIPLGKNGYPIEIPYDDGVNPPQAIRTLMFFGTLEGKYPSGKYRLMVSGKGKVSLWGAASGSFNCPVDTYLDVDSDRGGIALEIEESNASDPIQDIHFIMPGHENSFKENPFHPALIEFVDDFQVIRFMDWMNTNGSLNEEWENRNHVYNYTQTTGNGVAYEHIIDLCNRTQKDPWICVPHRASDDFISEMARLFRDSLDANLKLYVEYSNEVWNGIFSQSQYADSMGNVLGYSGNPWEQGWKYYAKRTADVHHIFETEFGANDRLVNVISSQAANPWVTNYIIERYNETQYNPNGAKADAIATAPYFAGGVANSIADAGLANSISVDDILDSMELSLAETYGWMIETKELAERHTLDFITYEGGQHLVAGWQHNNNIEFVNKLIMANQAERMEDIYCAYFNYWYEDAEGGMFCHFSSHALPSKYGSWGVKETFEDTLSPKYLGLQNCVFEYNAVITSNEEEIEKPKQAFDVYPQPTTGLININHHLNQAQIYIYDTNGNKVAFDLLTNNEEEIVLKINSYKGIAIIVLQSGREQVTKLIMIIK